jgi:hypothetical protein
MPDPRHWTPEQLRILREKYPDTPTAQLAAELGRHIGSVHQKATSLGIRKSAAFMASVHAGRIQRGKQNDAIKSTQFKPGLTPWNKGVKGYKPGGRSAETQFKKGAMTGAAAHNYLPIGSYRVSRDGHLEQKVTDDPALYPARRWQPVARLVWEAAHGPIPAKHFVIFKPGMKTAVLEEITPDKLLCITRAENALRNHPSNLSPELGDLYRLKGAINRHVNRIIREQDKNNEHTTHQRAA